jgi:hypothetical protein
MLHLKTPARSKLDRKHGVCIPALCPVRHREIKKCPLSVAPGRCMMPSLRVSDPSLLRWLLGFRSGTNWEETFVRGNDGTEKYWAA